MKLPLFIEPSRSRAENMRAIRSCGNKTTERRLVSLLERYRVRGWRLHPSHILGKPDFLIRRERLAIFVDGCFWHGCPRCGHIPKTNRAYWIAKIERNKRRDRSVSRTLRLMGFRVVRLWECQLHEKEEYCIKRIQRVLRDEHRRRASERS
jgi:DNA mismatch endonuclease (patch repair protein)